MGIGSPVNLNLRPICIGKNMISEARGMAQGVPKLFLVLVGDERGHWKLCDNSDAEVVVDRWVRPRFCRRSRKTYDADASMLPITEVM